jgi:hypothetical protein
VSCGVDKVLKITLKYINVHHTALKNGDWMLSFCALFISSVELMYH